jgi:hypothetical protein
MPFVRDTIRALRRSERWVVAILLIYAVSIGSGIVMVQVGNEFALAYRDSIVSNANQNDRASIAFQNGNPMLGALWDFADNLALGAVPSAIAGLSILIPFPLTAFRGWVGGIVSVNQDGVSRFASLGSATYYVTVIIGQVIPYSFATGAGLNLGYANLRPAPYYRDGRKILSLPREAVLDLLRVLILITPLFFVASTWEFLSPLNYFA